MLFFPVTGANFNGCSRVQPFKSKQFEFLFGGLICTDQTLNISINGQALGFSLFADPRLQFWVNGNGHPSLDYPIILNQLNKRDFSSANGYRREIDPKTIESAFLDSVIDGAPLPRGIPFPAEAIAALHHFLKGNNGAAQQAYAIAKPKIDPFSEGQMRKFEAAINGRKPQGLLPASPDDWLAVLLR